MPVNNTTKDQVSDRPLHVFDKVEHITANMQDVAVIVENPKACIDSSDTPDITN